MPVGYIAGLQPPQPSFSREGVQWHNTGTILSHRLRQLYPEQQEVEYAPEVASYAYYASSVASSSLSWGEHLRMVTFRQGLETAISVQFAFCGGTGTGALFQGSSQYSRLWTAILYTQMAYDLRRIVLEWSVSLPTYSGVLIRCGGTYLGIMVESASSCPVPHVSWVTLSLSGRMVPGSEKALVRHGATPQQVRKLMVAFWKAVLRMSRGAPPPTPPPPRDTGDWVQPGHTSVAYDTLYLA